MLPTGRKPAPDFSRLLRVLRRQGEPDRVPFFELLVDREIVAAVLEEPVASIEQEIRFWHALGYDCASVKATIPWPRRRDTAPDTADLSRGRREWVNVHSEVVHTRADFEALAWPKPQDVDYSDLERAARALPDGMKIMARTSGVLENTMWTLGFEGLSYLLADDPQLVGEVVNRVGSLLLNAFHTMASMDAVGALLLGEDMGFKTATMISPAALREFIFPWHRAIVDAAHTRGKPIILHSCGNLRGVMDDIIATGWDAKHSYEDVIQPITEAKELCGGRIAVLGGIDVDLLARGSEEDVRARVREVIRRCAPGGGYALGAGNSVTNYVPVRNYLAMLDEGWRCGRYPLSFPA
jgi:uroporphyrinogen decarboxylase